MKQLLPAVRACELFRDLPAEDLTRVLLAHGQVQCFQEGQHIITPQERVDRLGVVTAGRLHIMHIFPDGSRSLAAVLGPAEPVGADLLCTRSRVAPYHVVAASPAQAVFFPARLLEPGILAEEHRQKLQARLLTRLAQDSMKKEYRLAILSRKGLRERIGTYLLMQADRQGVDSIRIPFSREEMADYLCVNRSALSHELSLMQREGLITFRKNLFTLRGLRPGGEVSPPRKRAD